MGVLLLQGVVALREFHGTHMDETHENTIIIRTLCDELCVVGRGNARIAYSYNCPRIDFWTV